MTVAHRPCRSWRTLWLFMRCSCGARRPCPAIGHLNPIDDGSPSTYAVWRMANGSPHWTEPTSETPNAAPLLTHGQATYTGRWRRDV